jgi:hypothetical protein
MLHAAVLMSLLSRQLDQAVRQPQHGLANPLRADAEIAALVAIQVGRERGKERVREQAGVHGTVLRGR